MTIDGQIPARIETERLYLRAYVVTDKDWYCKMSENNRATCCVTNLETRSTQSIARRMPKKC